MVRRFGLLGQKGRFFLYPAKVVPLAWKLDQQTDCRIFQHQSTQQIIDTILKESNIIKGDYDFRLKEKYQPRPYCVA